SLDLRVSLRTSSDGSAETGPLAPGLYWVHLEEAQSFGSLVTVRAGHNQKQATVESGVVTEVVFRPRGAIEVRFWPAPSTDWRLTAGTSTDRVLVEAASPGAYKVPRAHLEAV